MIAQTIVATLKAVGIAVSYTHLDVYKRQLLFPPLKRFLCSSVGRTADC